MGINKYLFYLIFCVVAVSGFVRVRAVAETGGSKRADKRYYEKLVKEYKQQSIDTIRAMIGMLNVEILKRTKEIEHAYKAAAKKPEKEISQRRAEAIKVFEDFLKKYPNNPVYTPEVMFRLADLYYGRSYDNYDRAQEEVQKKSILYSQGKIPKPPKEPEKDYNPSIKLYRALLNRFPDYKRADAAEYLMGYSYEEMGIDEEAMKAYKTVVRKYPKGKMVVGAWMRLGEYYFDIGQWVKAQDAYKKVMEYKHSKFYEIAMYKLSWSYFQNNQYPTAIASFKRFIEYIDSGKGKKQLGAQLRDEAVEYLAYALVDDDWNGDGDIDPEAGVQRALSYLSDGKPYEREVLIKYADRLYEELTKKYQREAIKAYRATILMYPGHPDNALLEEKIILTYDDMNEPEKATEERERLIKDFGPGSKWFKENQKHPIAMARVERQLQYALFNAAVSHKKLASELRKQAETTRDVVTTARAIREYGKAAEKFKDFLRRYPYSPHNYNVTIWLADALYYSLHYLEAAKYYAKIRDWKGKTEAREYGAFNVIVSYEKAVDKAISSGRMPASDRPGEMGTIEDVPMPDSKTKVKVTPLPIPDLTKKWIAAVDSYLKLGLKRPNNKDVKPKLMYRVALEMYKRRHLNEARKRFEALIKAYPKAVVAGYAAANIINSYRLENDWKGIQLWAKKLDKLHLGKPKERAKLAAQIKVFKLGAAFKTAEGLLKEKKYTAAAKAFIKVVDQDPKARFADKALFNAAMAYIQVKKYDSANKVLTRLVTDKQYRNSKFIELSLAQLAETARKFFDFNGAVNAYQALIARFPNSKYAKAAFYQSALLKAAMGRYTEAANLFEQYSRRFEGSDNASEALYTAARYMEKDGNLAGSAKFYIEFIKRFGNEPGQGDKVIEAYWVMAKMAKRRGDMRGYKRLLNKVVSEFDARGIEPGTRAADYAAQIVFMRVNPKYQRYKAINNFAGPLKKVGGKIKEKKRLLTELEKDYSGVLRYKSAQWSAAAVYRLAEIYEQFAQALFDTPVPEFKKLPEDMREEAQDKYKDQLDTFANPLQNMALKRYKAMVANAAKVKIVNKWVKKARERLNSYEPQNYPLIKEGKTMSIDMEINVPELGVAK